MNTPAERLSAYQDALRSMGVDVAPLAAQAATLATLSGTEFGQALARFNAAADDGSYAVPAQDADYGALLLEALADACADPRRRQDLYHGALDRAALFASYATSGGEGFARSIDVTRIAGKLERRDTGQSQQGEWPNGR